MRRGLAKLPPPPSTAAFSTFSGAGGFGRGRGRASSPSPPSPVPGDDEDPFFSASGRGRGRGRGDGSHTSSPHLPSFPSLFPSSSSQGRGRGMTSPNPPPPQNPDLTPKKPVFFNRDDPVAARPTREDPRREPDMSSFVSALGRGKPATEPRPSQAVPEQGDRNRHMPKREDAARRAMEILSRGGPGSGPRGRGGTGRGGRGMQDRGPDREQMEGPKIDWREVDYYQLDYEDLVEYVEFVKAEIGEEEWNKCKEVAAKKNRFRSPSMLAALRDAERTNSAVSLFLSFHFFGLYVLSAGVHVVGITGGIYRYALGCCFILACEVCDFSIYRECQIIVFEDGVPDWQ